MSEKWIKCSSCCVVVAVSNAQSNGRYSFDREVERLEYNLKSTWRIAHINAQYKWVFPSPIFKAWNRNGRV